MNKQLVIAGFSRTLPVRVVSEANAHTHWRVRQRRAKQQRATVRLLIGRDLERFGRLNGKPSEVRLSRCSPRKLDSDNLAGAFKHVRDEIAAILGFDDRDEAVMWTYSQQPVSSVEGFHLIVEWKQA